MRALICPALLGLLGLAACSEQDRLTSGSWKCQPDKETSMVLTFKPKGVLAASLSLKDPSVPPPPDAMSIKITLEGQWVLKEDSRLDFAFRKADVTEAKRGEAPLDASTVSFYKDMFETSPKTSVKIVDLSGSKFTYQEVDGGKPVTCVR